MSFSSKGRVLTTPDNSRSQPGHGLKKDVPQQTTLNTCRDPHLQKPLRDSPGPCDPEADSSSKPLVFSTLVEYEGANSAGLECQPVDRQGLRPRKKDCRPQHSFSKRALIIYLEKKKKSHKQVYKKYYCPELVFKKGQQGKPKHTLELIRISRR